MKGPLSRPGIPFGGPFRKEKICLHPDPYDLDVRSTCVWQTWQRPTLPRLETKYHQRWSVSRPSSEWDRVQPLRHNHQVGKTHVIREAVFCAKATPLRLAFGRKPASATSASPIYRRPRGASGRRPIRRVSAGQTIVATILWIAPRWA